MVFLNVICLHNSKDIQEKKLFYFAHENIKQARKGFRPPSGMKGIEYFQKNLDLLGSFLGIF